MFNSEAYFDGEHSLLASTDPSLTRPGLAVIDNINISRIIQPPYGCGSGHDHGGDTKWLASILSDHGG